MKTYTIKSQASYKYAVVELLTEIKAESEEEALDLFKYEGVTVSTKFLDGNLKEESAGEVMEDE